MNDTSESQFGKILESIDEKARVSDESFEKLLVALAGVFRLLDGKQSMLTTLQGNPEEIQAYILKLLDQLRTMVSDGYITLKDDIRDVVQRFERT
ncbi:MAG: hypothetical protein ACW98Y_01540 [Candidatus Thorarchaeota archaeon]